MNKTETKKQAEKERTTKQTQQKPKSKLVLFREKYPNGYADGCDIISMESVMR
jgi:hypothetical protein